MPSLTADICVVGAGPAGCVIAARLAQLGFAVCLLERAAIQTPRLGESLSPGVLPLLDTIGARGDVEAAGFTRVRSVGSNWEGIRSERVDPYALGLLVDRGRFDGLLRARARTLGVIVFHPAILRERRLDEDGWQLLLSGGGTWRCLRVRVLVDATGRDAMLPGRRRRTGPRTVALYAYWTGRRLPEQPRIAATADAWCWGVPLPNGTSNALAFVDGASLRGSTRHSREAHYHELINRSGVLDGSEAARVVAGVFAADATPYLDESSVTSSHITVGDSALAIDPLSSSGVQKAIQTALSGAIVVNTLLRRPECSSAAIQYYRDSLRHASDRHRLWAGSYYARVFPRERTSFWAARSVFPTVETIHDASPADMTARISSGAGVRLSADAELIEVPRLCSDFVELGPALRHPSLDAPVAYLAGWELAPLLRAVHPGMSPLQLVRSWSPPVPFESGLAIAGWMLGRGILAPCERESGGSRPTGGSLAGP